MKKRLAAVAAALIGLAFLLLGAGTWASHELFQEHGERVLAEVTAAGRMRGGSRFVRYRFTGPDGRSYSGRSAGYGGRPGERILVEYLRFYPRWSQVAGAGRRHRPAAPWLGGAGAVLLFGGLRWLARLRRKHPQGPAGRGTNAGQGLGPRA